MEIQPSRINFYHLRSYIGKRINTFRLLDCGKEEKIRAVWHFHINGSLIEVFDFIGKLSYLHVGGRQQRQRHVRFDLRNFFKTSGINWNSSKKLVKLPTRNKLGKKIPNDISVKSVHARAFSLFFHPVLVIQLRWIHLTFV